MMKCTKCSEIVKPIVALDLDGTLGNYHAHFAAFASGYLQSPSLEIEEKYDGGEPYRDWFCETYGVDLTTFRQIKLAYRQGGLKRSMPVFEDAPGLTRDLRYFGIEVWITTTRPWERYDRVDPDTRFWLARNDIEFDGLIYDDGKYEVLSQTVDPDRVILVLDDDEDQLLEAERLFAPGVAVLRQTWFNRMVDWPHSYGRLSPVRDLAVARATDWSD